jgi:branched-chain amino acid transport system ATP-binding protein
MMLEVEAVHAGYATGTVLRGVSLSVREGQVVGLLGRNGMGKTTLLRSICGLHPPTVTAGSIRFADEDIAHLPSYEIARRGVSLVPQGRRVFSSLTVEENLRVSARPKEGGWDLSGVYRLFSQLAERRRHLAMTLSGGEQQMLAIGRSLMTNPRLLLMDEPSEGLAPALRDLVRDRLHQLKLTEQAVLLAEQNVDLVLEVADVVHIIGDAGAMAWTGDPRDLREDSSGELSELLGV